MGPNELFRFSILAFSMSFNIIWCSCTLCSIAPCKSVQKYISVNVGMNRLVEFKQSPFPEDSTNFK
jgi:hypothetical protein